jgi:hypothetical protein
LRAGTTTAKLNPMAVGDPHAGDATAARLTLVVVDEDGRVVVPMRVWDGTRDGADRQFPAHLDLILDPRPGEWWADVYGLARPPETFHRDRYWRDAKRRRSQWEVRVKQFRGTPPPPEPEESVY